MAQDLCKTCGSPNSDLPPTISEILTRWPDVIPNFDIDRTLPRCRPCELAAAKSLLQIEIGRAARTFKSPELEKMWHIVEAEKQDQDQEQQRVGIGKDVDNADAAMVQHRQRARCDDVWQLAIKYQRAALFLALMPSYFSIWGRDDEHFEWVTMPKLGERRKEGWRDV